MRFVSTAIAMGIAITLLIGCAGPGSGPRSDSERPAGGETSSSSRATARRMIAAVMSNPIVLSMEVNPSGIRGTDALEELLNVGLTIEDNRTVLQPRLAEAVPTIENGLWKVFPDGRMETTWRIRSGAQWHDGTPVTSELDRGVWRS